jgi:ribonuclease HII
VISAIKTPNILIGVDEVGRGPLAGPVCVCALALYRPLNRKEVYGLKDSKRLSKKQRELWQKMIVCWKEAGWLDYNIAMASETYIDKFGIQKSISTLVNRTLRNLSIEPMSAVVLLDGGLRATPEWFHQKTIIKGDETEAVIALASIAAKVHRDKLMTAMSKKHPEYDFEANKGYGTKAHIEMIHRIGPCLAHRSSYLKRLKKLDKSKNMHII